MFLSVKEMEQRKIRFDETFQPGQIDFSGEALEQASPLQATGVGRVAAAFGGRSAHPGPLHRGNGRGMRPLSGARPLSLGCGFDLFYRPASFIARDEEMEIGEEEAEIGFYERDGLELGGHPPGTGVVELCPCRGCAATIARESAPYAAETVMRSSATAGWKPRTTAGAPSAISPVRTEIAICWRLLEVEICRIPNVDTPRGAPPTAAPTIR